MVFRANHLFYDKKERINLSLVLKEQIALVAILKKQDKP